MAKKINEFISTFKSRGFLFNNRYEIFLTLNGKLQGSLTPPTILNDYIVTASIGNINPGAEDFSDVGLPRKAVTSANTEDITLNFMNDEASEILSFWTTWIENHVINSDPKNPDGLTLGWYDDYAKGNVLQVNALNTKFGITLKKKAYNVFPYKVDPISFNHEEKESVMKFNVTLSCRGIETL